MTDEPSVDDQDESTEEQAEAEFEEQFEDEIDDEGEIDASALLAEASEDQFGPAKGSGARESGIRESHDV